MTDQHDLEQLAALRARERLAQIAPDPTRELDELDALLKQIAHLDALRKENERLRDENKRLTAVAICAEDVVERVHAGQIPRHVVIDWLQMALNHLAALGKLDAEG